MTVATPKIVVALDQPNVCMTSARPVTVNVDVRNLDDRTIDLKLGMRGRLSALASIEPDRVLLEPAEQITAAVTFRTQSSVYPLTGPMPYAVTVRAMPEGAMLTVVFGLVDLHEQRRGRPFGSGSPCVRDI